MNIFDRKAKRLQKNRAAIAPDAATYDYLKDEVASHVVDRVCDVSRFFSVALDVGCGRGHVAKHMTEEMIGSLYQCDIAEKAVVRGSYDHLVFVTRPSRVWVPEASPHLCLGLIPCLKNLSKFSSP